MTPCRHHTRSNEFPINYSPKLGIFLCAQHEKFIIQDHIIQYLKSNINNRTNPQTQYETFSNSVYLRKIYENDMEHIPQHMNLNECLYDIQVIISEYTRNCIYTIIYVKNTEYNIQIGQYNQITINFTKNKSVYAPFDPNMSEFQNIILYYQNIHNNHIVYQNILEETNNQIHLANIQLLRIQLEQTHNEHIINQPVITRNLITETIKPIELTNISHCHICSSDELRKGYKMSCCNEDNTICVNCIINDKLINYNNYNSYQEIKDNNILTTNHNCFYCRQKITYKNITNDNECKTIFLELFTEKLRQETTSRDQLLIDSVRVNLGL
jgi:hypothetical protein